MGVDLLPGGKRLIIGDINDASGLIEEWNRTAPKEKRVKNFHLITEVNGVGGDAQEMLRECQSDQVLELQLIKVRDPWSHKDFVLAKVSEDGIWLEHASAALRNDRDVVLAAVLSVDPFDAVAKASVELLQEADFVLELVKETKAPWLLKLPELKHFAQNKSFRAQCDEVAGTGLVFTWYQSSTCFWDMRKHFSAITGSVPGGKASEAVVEELSAIEGGLSTVCFGDRPVFGAYADDGRWEHPLGAPLRPGRGTSTRGADGHVERSSCRAPGRSGAGSGLATSLLVLPVVGRGSGETRAGCDHLLRNLQYLCLRVGEPLRRGILGAQ
ncbi:unnamed protein product [Durusdinium trenchii]|uniref:DUF4116 domain-containing protein n=1 Tax=Durusdinium trenchii TaxID=1381693 RepID=A0ABP0KBS5_9DINO